MKAMCLNIYWKKSFMFYKIYHKRNILSFKDLTKVDDLSDFLNFIFSQEKHVYIKSLLTLSVCPK